MTMRFRMVHKTCSYLLVCTSMTALFMPGQIPPSLFAMLGVGVLVSWFWEPPRVDRTRFVLVWNLATLAVLAKITFDAITGSGVILSAVHFILFLGVNKLFNRQSNNDYQQLYVISLLQMIGATVLSTDPSFGVLFAIYIIFTTWVLILFHLKREIEDNLLLKYGESMEAVPVRVERILNSRRLIGPRFLATTSGISLMIFLGAALFFFLFPRVGFRLFHQNRSGLTMAGFNDRVELGQFGLIKDNPTIVMRIEFHKPEMRHTIRPYWRGLSFDRYDGKRWSKSRPRTKRTLPRKGKRIFFKGTAGTQASLITQNIYLDPMEQQVLFGLDEIVGLRLPRRQVGPIPARYRVIERDLYGDLYYEQQDDIAFNYEIVSRLPTHSSQLKNLTRADLKKYEQAIGQRSPYTQLPQTTSPAIHALAKRLIGSENNVFRAVDIVEKHLKTNYDYTLDIKRNEQRQPLDDFLFEQKRGHCEYFATAMAVLLRAQGIGTRMVNGFHGGQWNHYGKYLAVSQGDAHSWLEIQLPVEQCQDNKCRWTNQWVRRDPTPSGVGASTTISVMDHLKAYTDAFRMRWYKHVIEYDLEEQVSLVSRAQDLWRQLTGPKGSLSSGQSAVRQKAIWVLGAGLVFIILLGLVYRRRVRVVAQQIAGKPSQSSVAAIKLMDECLRVYERHGFVRQTHETPREFLETLSQEHAPGLDTALQIVNAYEALRLGAAVDVEPEIMSLVKALRQIDFSRPAKA